VPETQLLPHQNENENRFELNDKDFLSSDWGEIDSDSNIAVSPSKIIKIIKKKEKEKEKYKEKEIMIKEEEEELYEFSDNDDDNNNNNSFLFEKQKRDRQKDIEIQKLKKEIIRLNNRLKQYEEEGTPVVKKIKKLNLNNNNNKNNNIINSNLSFYNESDNLTEEERKYIDNKENQRIQELFDKYSSTELYLLNKSDNDNYLLLNIPFNEYKFNSFINNYNFHKRKYENNTAEEKGTYKIFYLNALNDENQIKTWIRTCLSSVNSVVMKVQMVYSVIWEAKSVVSSNVNNSFRNSSSSSSSSSNNNNNNNIDDNNNNDNNYEYYHQDIHIRSAEINPLCNVSHDNVEPACDYAMALLKSIQSKNSDGGESNHRIIAVTKLMLVCYFCDGGKIGTKTSALDKFIFSLVNNKFAYTTNLKNLCWFGCMSFILFPLCTDMKKENVKTRNKYTRELFYRFYSIENKPRNFKILFESDYTGFDITTEIERFKNFFNVSVNVFQYDKVKQIYKKLYSYVKSNCKYVLNVGLISVDNYSHVVWLRDVQKASECFLCPKCSIHIFHNQKAFNNHFNFCNGEKTEKKLIVSPVPRLIHPNLMNNALLKYLMITDSMDKFKPTSYYITYDFETIEENISSNSSSSSSSSIIDDNNTKTLSYIHPLSVASCAKVKNGDPIIRYFDIRDGDDFVFQWMNKLFEDAEQVMKDNMYENIDYDNEKIPLDVPVLGYNSSRFDLNFLISYLHNPPEWFIENTIGDLTSFKMIKVRNKNKVCLSFKDAMNFTSPQSLDKFVKSFGDKNQEVKGVFPYESINTNNVMEVLDKIIPFEQDAFFSFLKNTGISDKDYNNYLNDWNSKGFQSRWDYLRYYNINDVKIMLPAIDNLIKMMFEDKVDMLANCTLASCAQCLKYQFCFKNFKLNTIKYITSHLIPTNNENKENGIDDYDDDDNNDEEDNVQKEDFHGFRKSIPFLGKSSSSFYSDNNNNNNNNNNQIFQYYFPITADWLMKKCDSYNEQDKKKHRDISNNISIDDISSIQNMVKFQNNKCFICEEQFCFEKEPTFDRIENNFPHTLKNIVLCCVNCNRMRSNRSLEEVQLEVQLIKYAKRQKLPLTLIDDRVINLIQKGITGGLSNVYHRYNIRNKTKINKLYFDNNNKKVFSKNTDHLMTHVTGVDFNSLYPSSYSSIYNDMIDYTGHRMLMPGDVKEYIKEKQRIFKIIEEKNELFIVSVKGEIPLEKYNEFINFAPIFRNIIISKKQKKLTQLLSTMGMFMIFNNYYLWYLIDRFGFVIEDVDEMVTFEKNDGGIFTEFVQTFMRRRIKALKENNSGLEKYCKMILNAAYGKDGMNTAKYTKIKFRSKHDTLLDQCLPNFVAARKIHDDCYAVEKSTYFYKINTPIQEALFTLDNSKYWYLKFIYDFMYKCLDMNKIHFIEGDTDSSYWAISGNPSDDCHQQFKYVIRDIYIYDAYIFKWFPNPQLGIEDEKKLLGLSIEKEGVGMIALAPKCYCFCGENNSETKKSKGIQLYRNPEITLQSYVNCIEQSTTIYGVNVGFRTIKANNTDNSFQMIKYKQTKLALSPIVLDKMYVFPNHQSCAPIILGFNNENYMEI
jgi:hypothetical protein